MGVVALFRLPVELRPNVEVGNITIALRVRGGISPIELEDRVAKPLEEALGVIDGLEDIITISEEGECQIILYFKSDINLDYAVVEVREHFAQVQDKLPKEVERPVIAKYEYSQVPVVILGVTSKDKTVEELRKLAEHKMKNRFSRIEGVAKVEIGGGREEKIFIELNETLLRAYGLAIDDVIQTLNMNNLNLVAGEVKKGGSFTYLVRTVGQFRGLEDIRNLPINPAGGSRIVRIKDVSEVKISYLDPHALARVNAEPSISLYIQQASGANTIKVVEAVEKELKSLKKELPADIVIKPYFNHAEYIKQAIRAVCQALFIGALLTVLVLWLFLRNVKYTAVVVLTIPFSVIAALSLMYFSRGFTGISINVVTLSGLALGIGILVDSSIVVLENIFKKRRALLNDDNRLTPEQLKTTAERGASEVLLAIVASTLTTIVVFLPLVFVNKDIQRLYSSLAWAVVFTLLTSSFLAFTFVPLLASRISTKLRTIKKGGSEEDNEDKLLLSKEPLLVSGEPPPEKNFHLKEFLFSLWHKWKKFSPRGQSPKEILGAIFADLEVFSRGVWERVSTVVREFDFRKAGSFYAKGINFVLTMRYLFIGVSILLLLAAVVQITHLGREFIGIAEQNRFTVYVQMPSGTKIEISDEIVGKVEKILKGIPEVKDHTSRVKSWSSRIYVELKPYPFTRRSIDEIIEEIRQKTEGMEPAFIYCQQPESVGRKEIMLELFGPDYDLLKELAQQTGGRIKGAGQFKDIKLRMRSGRPEIHIFLDRNRLSLHKLTILDVSNVLHAKLRGLIATRFHTSGIMLRERFSEAKKLPTLEEYGRKTLQKELKKLSLAMSLGQELDSEDSEEVETITRLEKKFRDTLDDIFTISLKTKDGEYVYLQQIAEIKPGVGPAEIWRKNKERMVQVSADTGRLSLSKSAELVNKALSDLDFPKDYYYNFGGDYEKMLQNQRELTGALILALFLVYMILASVFESFVQPFIVLSSVPLAVIGVAFGLRLANEPICLGVYIGSVVLIGIVVNNAIILIDYINRLRGVGAYKNLSGEKLPAQEAVKTAAIWRLRPILMTSLTTILTMLPLIFQRGGTSTLWRPLAVTIASGMTISTFLTLFIIPSFYLAVDDIKKIVSPKRLFSYFNHLFG